MFYRFTSESQKGQGNKYLSMSALNSYINFSIFFATRQLMPA